MGCWRRSRRNDGKKYQQLLRHSRHMDSIVEAVVDLGVRETRTVELDAVPLDQLVNDVVETVRVEAGTRNVEIELLTSGVELGQENTFLTDETKLYEILLNLLVNAVKYGPPGGCVLVNLSVTNEGIEVRLEDQGPGIPEDELPSLFEPFIRGSYPQAQGIPGLGLGLYIADLYTGLLQGKLRVSNRRDGGAEFILSLPRLFAQH